MLLNNYKFHGSYLIAPLSIRIDELNEYEAKSIGDFKIYHSNDINIKEVVHHNSKIIIIGYCFDIRKFDLTTEEILESLTDSEDMVHELEYINGRYNILIENNNKVELFSDASQLQPLVYHKESKTLASHDLLLQKILKNNGIQNLEQVSDRQSELDFTRFERIYKFNPSLKLELEAFDFERIYPGNELTNKSVKEVIKEIKPYLDQSISWIRKQPNKKFLSITGGIDSRVSAALTSSFSDEVEYLTYYTPPKKLATRMAKVIHMTDRKIAEQLKNNLKWNHSIINIFDYQPSKEQYAYLNQLFNSRHAFGLINYYRDVKKYDHAIHIKSTVYGLGKADFDKELDDKEDTFEFYRRCIHGLSKDFEKLYDVDKEVTNYFDRNLVYEGVTRNRHYFDLFHLESRMGNWHSILTLESDPEVDEFIFVNTRKFIDLIQQPNIQDRRDFKLYKELINEYWPVLLHFGINRQENMYEGIKSEKQYLNTIVFEPLYKMDITVEDNAAIAVPLKGMVKVEENFSFKVTSKESKFKLSSKYNNPKGKGKLKVIIRNEYFHDVYDIIDLNNGLTLEPKDTPYTIMVLYNNTFRRETWSEAGKLIIEEV